MYNMHMNCSDRSSIDSELNAEAKVTPLDTASISLASACSQDLVMVKKGLASILEGKVLVLLSCSQVEPHSGVQLLKQLFATLNQRLEEARVSAGVTTIKRRPILAIVCPCDQIEPLQEILRNNNYFGVKKSQIKIIEEAEVPRVDLDGKVVLASTFELSLQPQGFASII